MKKLLNEVLAIIIYVSYVLWGKTLRLKVHNFQYVEPHLNSGFVLALWHAEMFPLIYLKNKVKVATIASKSKDGEFITRILNYLGFKIARGSSSRGGAQALLSLVKYMQDGYAAAITIDGPRGPRHEVKSGAIFLAQKSQKPIIAIRAKAHKAKVFGSWDKFILPLPFSKVEIFFAKAYYVNDELNDEKTKEHCDNIKKLMDMVK